MLVRLAPWLFVTMWSTGYIGMKLGAPYAEPMTFLSIRFLLVLALLVPAFLLMGVPQLPRRDWLNAMFIGAWLHGIYLAAVLWAIKNGMAAGVAALIISLQPILTAVAAPLLLGEAIPRRNWLGLALGALGVGLVIFPGLDVTAPIATPLTLGVCVLSLASITFATLYQKATAANLDLKSSLIPQFAGAAGVVSVLALVFETREVTWSAEFVFAQAWLVLVLSIGAVSLLLYLLRENAAWRTSALFYLIPPITAVFAWALFGEVLQPLQIAGMAVVMTGVLLSRA
jgi:drug/metabolite transporter (DMT)-like permease